MGDQEVRRLVHDALANRTSGPADDAPPEPKAALELLKANGCPIFRRREQSEAAA